MKLKKNISLKKNQENRGEFFKPELIFKIHN